MSTEAWYSGAQQGQPAPSGTTGIMRFKDFYGIGKERTLSNDWEKELSLAKEEEVGEVVDDLFGSEEEVGYDEEFLEDPHPDVTVGYPDSLNVFQQTVSAKPPRRDSRVDYNHKQVLSYKAFEELFK